MGQTLPPYLRYDEASEPAYQEEIRLSSPGEIFILPPGFEVVPLHPTTAPVNCRNCGAPPESICSYCRTPNPLYAAFLPTYFLHAPDVDVIDPDDFSCPRGRPPCPPFDEVDR